MVWVTIVALILDCKIKEKLTYFFYALIGSVAGVYVGMEYGVGRIRGSRDWVCSLDLALNVYFVHKQVSKGEKF